MMRSNDPLRARRRARLGLLAGLAAAFALATTAAPAASDAQAPLKLVGAGASFPAPLYLRWFRSYFKAHPDVHPDYQYVGSVGGIKDLIAGRIDFAGVDYPVPAADADQVAGGVVQFPLAAGAIVLVYNLDGVPNLRLSRAALLGIFLGQIARWNDPQIAATNPGVALPDQPITVVVRTAPSGTSLNFTDHLSAISPEFAAAVGTSLGPVWPTEIQRRGALISARGNDGVATMVQAIPGSIGYVQYAYGFLSGMTLAAVENRAGNIVPPNLTSFGAAMEALRSDQTVETLRDPPGDASYPMIAISWIVMRRAYPEDPAKLPALLDLFDYCLGPGQADVAKLGYIPFSAEGIDYVKEKLAPLRPAGN